MEKKNRRKNLKGQIEFVAVVALIVLVLLAVFFLLQPSGKQGDPWSNMLSDEQRLIRDSIKNFLRLATEEELTHLYEQGGFIDITGTVNIKFSGLEIPLWVSCGNINVPDIEYELSRGINQYIVRNLEKETEFYGKDTIIDVSKLATEVVLQNGKIVVKVHLPATVKSFEMPPEYEIEVSTDLKNILEFSQGFTYELNETRFLEMITIMNMLHSNESNDAWTPIKGILTKCGERVVVRRNQFLKGTEKMIRYTVSHLVWDRNPPRIANDPFFVLKSIKEKYYDLDVSFFYPEEWDDEIPEKFVTVPETLRKTAKPIMFLVPFCMEQYAVSYSFQYPVIIAVKDVITNQYFRFAVYVSIKDNQPDMECNTTLFGGRTDYEKNCVDNAECDFNIRVTDTNGNPIENADITFYECDLGYTDASGMLVSDTLKIPCMMSELVVRKEGFMSAAYFVTPEDLETYYEVNLERIARPMKMKYYGIPVVGINRGSEGKFENFVVVDQVMPINLIPEYFTDYTPPSPPPIFSLETNLVMEPLDPNPFTEEDADFVITNRDYEDNLVHVKNETIIHPIKYNISGTVYDTKRDTVIGYINQVLSINEGVDELCVYFPVVVGDLSPPYLDIISLDRSVRNDQAQTLQQRLISAGLPYMIGECGSVSLTACGDGYCQPGETCETDGNVKCPGMTEALPPDTCRITCTYCGDGVWDHGWEECDKADNSPTKNYGEGTSEDNQYVCNATCQQDEGWCGDTIVQDGITLDTNDHGEECDLGEDKNCCEGCKWTCDENSWEMLILKFTGDANDITLEDEDSTFIIEFPACRIHGNGLIDAELIVSAEKTAIIFVTDTSRSMSAEMEDVKNALKDSIDALHDATVMGGDIHVGLVRYSSSVSYHSIVDVSEVSNKNDLKGTNGVDSYSAAGDTYTDDGIQQARNLLNSFSAVKKIIVLLSDGSPSSGHDPTGQANGAKNTDGILIYSIAFTTQSDLQTKMCSWSSDNGANCYTDKYSYTSTDAAEVYSKITDSVIDIPEGEINVTINDVKTKFTAENNMITDIPLDLSGVNCSDSEQTLPFTPEFEGGGSIKFSNARLEYCEACQV